LINSASGGVGTFAVQIAKALGAAVTGVYGSGSAETVRALGADCVIDYGKEDFLNDGKRYDLILDIAANRSVKDYRQALKPGGICVVVGFSTFGHMLSVGLSGKKDGKKIGILAAKTTRKDDLIFIGKLFEAGTLTPSIDRRFPLARAAEAMRYMETGHPKGKVIIEMP
jgi:NADPH:quinone reductase-like Zn-dependent oxidoreductase